MKDFEDNQLIEQYCAGNDHAFDQLYQRYRLPVFNYIFRQVKSQNVADDIFQDVWLRVIKSLQAYNHQGQFLAWLFTIARNRLTDHWRQQKPQDAPGSSIDIDDEQIADTVLAEHVQFLKDCMERLLALLQILKPEQRDAFVLQQESGLSLEEIAQVSNCGRETIKSRLRYAMNKLRKGLEGCDES